MTYESQFREEMDIIREAKQRCMIYSASYNPRYYYPFKLRAVGKGWEALDKSCFELMIDSNINDDTVTNEEVLDEAVETQATKIIPKDYPGQPERTLESLIEFKTLAEEKYGGIAADVIPVLQDPHAGHLKEHIDHYEQYSHIAIGGMKGNAYPAEEKIRRIKQVRDVVGDSTHIHGFGMGCSISLIKAIRQNPNLLDSLDMSTAEKMVMNGKVADWTLNQKRPKPPMPYGDDKSTVNGGFSKAVLVMLNYMLTGRVNESKLEEMFYNELGFDKLEKIIAASNDETTYEADVSELQFVGNDGPNDPIDERQTQFGSI